ncbi:MAG: adenine phosphoribosyltransferase, partial [Chloroflexia bacterium]|nr:adenine phosphoribosyltransferase [Chloroflexia bacterium]
MTQPLASYIRNIPDFPIPGIQFKDITTLLRDGSALHRAIDVFVARYKAQQIDAIVAIESRGFIF